MEFGDTIPNSGEFGSCPRMPSAADSPEILVPHSPQNFRVSGLSEWHFGHLTVTADLFLQMSAKDIKECPAKSILSTRSPIVSVHSGIRARTARALAQNSSCKPGRDKTVGIGEFQRAEPGVSLQVHGLQQRPETRIRAKVPSIRIDLDELCVDFVSADSPAQPFQALFPVSEALVNKGDAMVQRISLPGEFNESCELLHGLAFLPQ